MYKKFSFLLICFLLAACNDGGGGGAQTWYKAMWGYPDVSGSYTVEKGSTCPFTKEGNSFSISQSEGSETAVAKLDISASGLNISASISKEGNIAATIKDGATSYNCSGGYSEEKATDYINQKASLSCAADSSTCTLVGSRKESLTGGGAFTLDGSDESAASSSGTSPIEPSSSDLEAEAKESLKKYAMGTWCYSKESAGGSAPSAPIGKGGAVAPTESTPDSQSASTDPETSGTGVPFVAIYVDADLNISVSDPANVKSHLSGGIISYINATVKSYNVGSDSKVYIKYLDASPNGYAYIKFSEDKWAKVDDVYAYTQKSAVKLDKCY